MSNSPQSNAGLPEIQQWLRHEIARVLCVAPEALDTAERFHRLGLDSARVAGLSAALTKWLEKPVSPMLFWKYPTLDALAKYLASGPTFDEDVSRGESSEAEARNSTDEPIAIIGIGCRFPGDANSPEQFWRLLSDGVDAVGEIPAGRWKHENYFDEDYTVPGKTNTRWGGFLNHIDKFDPLFFGITPREAAQMDPQQRLMLELSWEAIEDAGLLADSLRESRTGVFFGAVFQDYSIIKNNVGAESFTAHTTAGSIASIISNRVSYALGLQGPSMTLDTACSSSLVAVHLACQSLRAGECTLALAGGVNLMLAPQTVIGLSQLGVLSPDGRCRSFDAGANGFVRAEGGGVIALKRLSHALRDGDPIYCVVRGSAVNNDGASNGLTAPNPQAQEALIREACRNAGIEPQSLHYVEAHGPGTPIGDPIEASALGAVCGRGRAADRPLLLGSVKTNLGHLEAASGMAGLVKVALSLKHALIPPNLHFRQPNPDIDFDELRLKIVTELQPWPVMGDERRRAGISAFGLGGTNGHLVLEDMPAAKTVLFIGAERAAELHTNVRHVRDSIEQSESSWKKLARESVRTANETHRLAVVAKSCEELKQQLQEVLSNRYEQGVFHRAEDVRTSRDAVWVFSGVGAQWPGMGRSLMAGEPVFRATLERCGREIKRHLGWSLLDVLTSDAGRSRLERIDVLWPTLYAFQVALAEQWRAFGIKPAAIIGHSLGEVAAAYAAGALTLEDSAHVACEWARLVERARGNGAMALVALGWEEAGKVIAPYGERLSRGVNSSPNTTVLSGDVPALDEVVAQLTAQAVFARRIAVTIAAHSPRMTPAVKELPELLATIRPSAARVPLVSTNLGGFIGGEEFDGSYWQRQVCEPVLFAQGINCLIGAGHTLFLELGPHPAVSKAVEECLGHAGKKGTVVSSLFREEHEANALRDALATLYVEGATIASESSVNGKQAQEDSASQPLLVLPVSGRKEQSKRDYARSLAEHIEQAQDISLTDLCFTASLRRAAHTHRAAVVAHTRDEFVNALEAISNGEKHPAVSSGTARSEKPSPVAFVFPGQGSQWHGMARQLLVQEPVFRAALEECDRAISKYTDWSLLEELSADAASSNLHRVDVVQPALFAIAVGLSTLWRSWGIEPAAVVGHSMGEVAASYVAGALSLDDAARIICLRSKLLRRVSGQGAMAVTELPRAKAEQYLAGYQDRVSIAVCNSPCSTVLSGDTDALDEILARLEAAEIFCRRVKVDVASHSPQMEPLREDLLAALSGIEPRAANIPIYSTVTGKACDGSRFDAAYWVSNLREPVQFATATEALLEAGIRTFVEISPHPLLSGNVREILKHCAVEGTAVASLRRDEDERASLLTGLAALHCLGQPVAFASLYPQGGRVVSLPNYAWQRERYWLTPEGTQAGAAEANALYFEPAKVSTSTPHAPAIASTGSPDSVRLYFHNSWQEAPLSTEARRGNTSGSILILGTSDTALREGRAALSAEHVPVVLVKPGRSFRDLGGLTYEINPLQPNDYQRLVNELAQQNLLPGRIIHGWSKQSFSSEQSEMQEHLEQGVYSVLYLSQALLEQKPQHETRLWYVYQTNQAEVLPQHAALSGSFKTIRQENPKLIYKTLEIRPASDTPLPGNTKSIWELLAREVRECRDDEFEVRYEGESRYARQLKEVELEDQTRATQPTLPLKAGGVYLITGGAGGLGLLFAEHLAKQQQRVKLVLTGRSPLNAEIAAQLKRLESFGAEAIYIPTDISRREQVATLVKEIKSRYGAVSGVLHVAGVLNRAFLSNKRAEDVALVLSPKVYGTLYLDEVLKDEPLDFFVLFSSISAVKGYEGLFDYAYGNSFMDHFAERRENLRATRQRSGRTVSINWSLWQDGGMKLASVEAALFLEQTGLEVLNAQEGTKLYDVCVSQAAIHQCLVGYGNREKFTEFLSPFAAQTDEPHEMPDMALASTSTAPASGIPADLLRAKTETFLKEKLAAVTGLAVEEFDPQEKFAAYGIDSVIVHHFNARVAKELGPVSKTLLFENRNIKELTDHFVSNYTAALSKLFNLGTTSPPKTEVKKELPVVAVSDFDTAEAHEQKDDGTFNENDIAIIGVAGRYPQARNLDEFWENLKSGVDCINEIRSDRWDYRKFYDPDPEKSSEGKTYSKWGGLLEDVDKFDPLFFNLSTKEAESMDPQERLFLETAWATFEDAGYTRASLREHVRRPGVADVGVFVGCTSNTHMLLGPDEWNAGNFALPLSMTWSIANRVSHVFDLRGPSLHVDTGCAASLTALHLACESLKRGEASMALAGGVNLVLHPSKYFYPSRYRMLSPTGKCRAFGSEADGIVLGEGAGAVLLKPLNAAVRDGDQIYAVIRGTASNHGGQVHGYTVPNPHAQADLILQALNNANIDARTISCIEAHGTGTPLGDPIEVAGLTKAFREYTADKQFCALGSVKSNIGHLEGAAGIAGLTKLLLQLKHRQLAPSLHAETVNHNINFEATPFLIRRELTEWKQPVITGNGESQTLPRRAGISSFGAGGSNAHVLLEEFENAAGRTATTDEPHWFLLSARSDERLHVYAGNLADFLEKQTDSTEDEVANRHDLADIAYTLQVGREPLEERLAIQARSHQELIERLRLFVRNEPLVGETLRATVRNSRAGAGMRKESEENIERWLENGQLTLLLKAWMKGAGIAWSELPQNSGRRKVSLPTYPFLRERVWIHDREVLCDAPAPLPGSPRSHGLHPLIDSNESTLSEQRYKKLLTGDEFFLRDHRAGAHLVLPGVAIAEMARAAGELAAGRRVRKLRNIVFSSPVSVDDEPRPFFIGLEPNGEAVDFEVYSLTENQQKVSHTQGKLVYESATDAAFESEPLDIEAIKKRCPAIVNSADGYARLRGIGMQLGASFQPVGEIHCSETEAIARLELPSQLKEEFAAFVLHPSLMDGAQQVAGLTTLLGKQDCLRVPFAVGEIEILRPLTEVCYAHVTLVGGDPNQPSTVRKFDIRLADEAGRVLIAIKRFQAKEFFTRATAQSLLTADSAMEQTAPEAFYFQSAWQHSELLVESSVRKLNGTILLFDTGEQLRDALQARLNKELTTKAKVILVKPGKNYRSFGDQGYTIDPRNPEDYRQLFAGLQSRNRMPDSIIHLWSQGSFTTESESLQPRLDESIYSIFHLSQALLQHELGHPVQLLYAYSSRAVEPQPQYAALSGFANTLQRENSKLICKSLELRQTSQTSEPDTASDFSSAQLAELLACELLSGAANCSEIRYEDGKRLLHGLEEVQFASEAGNVVRTANVELKEQGVYLLTGGLGGLGLIFAQHLARKVKARLVLTGRSDISNEQESLLRELCASGAEAIYIKADVSRREEVAALVNRIKAQYGRIDGVIHSAGVTRDAFVRNKTRAEIEAVFAPKVFGTIHLDEALENEPLDFFAMFSSTTALLGQMGQSDYGYANRFMDHFAEWREAHNRHGKTISINWPFWRDGGMRIGLQAEELLFTSTGMKAMTTEAGLMAFERALASAGNQLFVINGDHDRIIKTLNPNSQIPTTTPQAINKVEPRTDDELLPALQKDLVKTVSAILKISETRIGFDKNLSDYGFDSVSLVEFSNRVNRKYQLEITPAIFFEYPTLNAFAYHLHDDYHDAIAPHYPPSTPSAVRHEPASIPVAANDKQSLANRLRPAAQQATPARTGEDEVMLAASTTQTKEPIAIIGMSGVMPQSEDLKTFWRHLEEGHDLVTEIPGDRWDWRAYFGNPTEESNKTNSKWGGFISDADKFDARFFGISRREAEFMDPQQRVFLETVWKAIEDAGYKASELAGRKIGVFAGVGGLDYGELMRDNGVSIEAYSTTGVFHCILANRVSYLLNLSGPSVPVDTGCSSAIVAIRQAIEAMWSGSCEMAIAGGVNILLSPSVYIAFGKAGMLSIDGKCKTFDKSANGYVRAEGAGVVLLKPLSKAIADGDNIHAIIRGSAVNHGGRVNTLTAPNPNAQAELIKSAFAEGNIDPSTVSYIEAHGTGTSLGDPIEINGLKKAFKEMFQERGLPVPEKAFCGIGAVKTNTGHLETAAAMAGIFKVLLGMKHNKIPASIHFNEINPYIQLENSPFYLVDKNGSWERRRDASERELPRRAGVSSFGFGGVNGHLVLEEFISQQGSDESGHSASGPQVILLSARNEERLKVYAARLAEFLEDECGAETQPQLTLPADGNLLPLIHDELLRLAASVTGIGEQDIYLDEPFAECGLDPIHLTSLAGRINEQYGLALASDSLLGFSSLDDLATHLWDDYRAGFITHFRVRLDRAQHRPSLADVAYTLQVGREAMPERLAFVAGSMEELIIELKSYSQGTAESHHLYKGNVERQNSQLGVVLDGAEGAGFINLLVQGRKLDKLAQLWVSGVNVDWKTLTLPTVARRISLPTYPFAKDRYWFPVTTAKVKVSSSAALHALIDEVDTVSDLHGGFAFKKTLKRDEPIVAQHNVGGQLVLPGVGHLAMVIAAASRIKESKSLELSRVLWLRPLIVEGDSKEVRVLLREENEALSYEVRSGGESETVTHSTGMLRQIAAPAVRERLSIEKIKARCEGGFDKETLYRKFSRSGVTLGRYFQTLEQAWMNQEELLAPVSLPSEYEAEAQDYFVHPTMMDAALQAMGPLWMARQGEISSPLLPFAVEKVELLHRLGARGYVYVRAAGEQRFNAAMLDESGRVCIKLHEVTLLVAKEPAPASHKSFYYRPTWKAAPINQQTLAVTNNGNHSGLSQVKRETILLVHPSEDLGLNNALRTAHAGQDVFEVYLGTENRQLAPNGWEIRTSDPSALDNCIRQLPAIDRLYFLGGIQLRPVDINHLSELEESQERGVVSLYRLVKSLSRSGIAQTALKLTVVTNDAHQVLPGESIKPYAASLFGFAKSLAKEYPQWNVNCLDIRQDEAARPEVIAELIAEPHSAGDGETALRDGRRFVRTIEPVELLPAEQIAFRQEGVYLILGGAGGIGLELSKHLAQNFHARLILIGRRPLTASLQQQLASLEALGSEALYLQADAANHEQMSRAVREAKARFGRINGVIHSALVLRDTTIEQMTEEDLSAALLPKVAGSVNLHRALEGEELDFMLYFSSGQSFSGNAGQANYAAGCTFKDAYARYVSGVENYPVKVINWGYWGEVGVVASEEYRRRLAIQGIGSISIAEGIDAVQRILCNRVEQVVALHADERQLKRMGVDLSHQIEVYPAQQSSVIEAALKSTQDVRMDSDNFAQSLVAFDEVERFGQYLLLDVFQRMGVFLHAEESYDKEELRERLCIVPTQANLYEAMLGILSQAGFILTDGQQITGTYELGRPPLQREVENLAAKRDRLASSFPQKAAHLDLLWVCMQAAPGVLRGEIPATEVMFPNSSMELVTGIYKNNLAADYFNQLVVANLKSYIESRLGQLKPHEKITILEIGAGTGGTSAALFAALSPYSQHLRYLYTDISQSFTQYGKRQYGITNPYVEFRVLDIEREVESQGYEAGTCDVVIATNVLHATSRLERTLSHAKSLLKTHGWLVVNEGTATQNFATLTFGLLEGWWLYEDAEQRLAGSPLLSAKGWQHLLTAQGFERVIIQGQLDSHGRGLGQNVIVAESNGLIRHQRVRPLQTPELAATPAATLVGTDKPSEVRHIHAEPRNRKDNASHALTPVDVRRHIENTIIEILADVLQLEKQELYLDTPYASLGVDSILSVEIVNRLNTESGINLRSTDLFNYSTIRTLTEHVVATFGADIQLQLETSAIGTEVFETVSTNSIETQMFYQDTVAESYQVAEELPEFDETQLFANAQSQSEVINTTPSVKTVQPEESISPASPLVAVIGMAGRFPDADNVHEFWNNLASGRNSIREATRWNMSQLYDPDPRLADKSYGKWAGLLSGIELFDPLFFNISPKEAEMMDPRQRLFLEETWKALEDAGYSDKQLEGKACSVFVGCGPGDYKRKIAESGTTPNPYIFTGNQNSILAARISYLLNLKGPSVPIDTACSSSLVALHLACESIRNGLSEMAIAGGSEVICTPEFLVLGSRANMLSAEGQCKTFDQHADGFVPGETVGCLILKSVEAALRDHDHIYGVISGSGINQDGKTNGITSPSAPSQTALECEVYDRFGIDPAEITYVEAHGTGTRLGDPIEVQALTDAFGRYTAKRGYCGIGSVKTNIGHTLTAAGVASVIKVLLSLKHRQLPPSLNFEQPNEHINFADSPFYVNTELRDWEAIENQPRRAAVSSFGFSGTNAHLVISEAQEQGHRSAERAPDRCAGYLVVLSAKTPEALRRKVTELQEWLSETEKQNQLVTGHQKQFLRDIAYTLQVGRSQYQERVALVAGTIAELEQKLRALSESNAVIGSDVAKEQMDESGGARLLQELAAGRVQKAEQYRAGLERLAQMYERGAELNWSELYKGEDYWRVSLPAYPFAGEYFWVPESVNALQATDAASVHKLHPLVERNSSNFEEQRFTTRLDGNEFFLSDHVIENRKILPGVAYLEMARAASELSGGRRVQSLRNVVWMKPLTFETDPREMSISLRPKNNGATYEVWTTDDEGRRVSHAQGEVIYERNDSSTDINSIPDFIDIESIRGRCGTVISGESCYEVFHSLGFDYGPSFRVIQELVYSEREVLARLELPGSQRNGLKDFVLHPSLLDGALQSGLWLMDVETVSRTRYLPFALGEVRIAGSLSRVCYAHVTPSSRQANIRKFTVRLLDEAGRVLVLIKDYSARAQRQPLAREVKSAFTTPAFEARGELFLKINTDEAIADLFQKVEAGELDVAEALRLVEQLDGNQTPLSLNEELLPALESTSAAVVFTSTSVI